MILLPYTCHSWLDIFSEFLLVASPFFSWLGVPGFSMPSFRKTILQNQNVSQNDMEVMKCSGIFIMVYTWFSMTSFMCKSWWTSARMVNHHGWSTEKHSSPATYPPPEIQGLGILKSTGQKLGIPRCKNLKSRFGTDVLLILIHNESSFSKKDRSTLIFWLRVYSSVFQVSYFLLQGIWDIFFRAIYLFW